MVSHVLCQSCLLQITLLVYPRPVCFEPAPSDAHGTPWLDVWLYSEQQEVRVRADGAEHEWRESAGSSLPKKFRVRPWLGHHACDFGMLKSCVASKLVRLKALHLPDNLLASAIACELCIWALSGYPLTVIRKCWTSGSLSSFFCWGCA